MDTKSSGDDKKNSPRAETTEDDSTSRRHCIEAYPGHDKKKRILEVKKNPHQSHNNNNSQSINLLFLALVNIKMVGA